MPTSHYIVPTSNNNITIPSSNNTPTSNYLPTSSYRPPSNIPTKYIPTQTIYLRRSYPHKKGTQNNIPTYNIYIPAQNTQAHIPPPTLLQLPLQCQNAVLGCLLSFALLSIHLRKVKRSLRLSAIPFLRALIAPLNSISHTPTVLNLEQQCLS